MRLTWVQPEDLFTHELAAAQEEGKDVAEARRRWLAAGGSDLAPRSGASDPPASPALRTLASELIDQVDASPAPADPAEPDQWDQLVELMAPVAPAARPAPAALAERIAGAWYGRAAGCLLGKPVEKIPRAGIEAIARATGRWPLDRYFTELGLPAAVAERWPWNRRSRPTSLAENIDGMPEDDDLNYPMLALRLLESAGPGFTTADVAQLWLDSLPAGRVFTAERAAYRNLLLGLPIDQVAVRRNPFRQWIGALIRTDLFGWTAPGDPVAAARLAWTDAWLSHRRNGLYGAMWAAALASSALVCDSPAQVLDRAQAVLPPRSGLAQAVQQGRAAASLPSFEDGLDRLHQRYGHLHWVHVLNNAATIAFALQRGAGDFTSSVGLAVMAGWDTDSAAATVGGVVGALNGLAGIGPAWTDPLKGVIRTSLPGGDQAIDDLARRTLDLVSCAGSSPRKVAPYGAPGGVGETSRYVQYRDAPPPGQPPRLTPPSCPTELPAQDTSRFEGRPSMTDTTDRKRDYEVVVVGSANADLVIEVARHPHAGETVLGGEVRRFPGGKGANQAVAAARAGGARTAFLGALGSDDGAAMLRASLDQAGVDTSHVVVSQAPTGLAVITVSPDGDNAIVVAPGANHSLVLDDALTSLVARAGAVLAQLEIPLDTVQAAAQAAQGVFILNAAPSQSLPSELLAEVDVLVVNEHEAAEVAGRSDEPADLAHLAELAEALTEVVPAAVITLGSRGSLVARRGQPLVQIPSLPVQPVDTTGAGDTFCGVLAAQLAAGADLPAAARLASAAGALATTKHGAQPAIPTAAEVAGAAQRLGQC